VSGLKIPRQPYRHSGRTSINADVSVHEPQAPPDPYSPLAFSMEGYDGIPPAPLIPRFLAPGWNSPQAVGKYQSRVGGPLAGGDPGRRILAHAHGGPITYHGTVPDAFRPREGYFLLVPLHHLFGTEELSSLSSEISEVAPGPYIALNPQDAKVMGVNGEGTVAELVTGSASLTFPVRLADGLPDGMAGFPSGLRSTVGVSLPQWVMIRKGQA
jgi:NADH-quinone oxidoreductase subunit G